MFSIDFRLIKTFNMASKAEESLGVYFRKLYNSDDREERDFTFLSKEKTRFPVHSFMFRHR